MIFFKRIFSNIYNKKNKFIIFVSIFFFLLNTMYFLRSSRNFIIDNNNLKSKPNTQINYGYPISYAILIGIEDYPGCNLDLKYCVDDIKAVRSLLVNEMGYLPENIYSISNRFATSSDIENIFNELKNKVTPNDTLFFYYSGHGLYGYKQGDRFDYILNNVDNPYKNNTNEIYNITHLGVDGIRVHIQYIDVEKNFDVIGIGDDTLNSTNYKFYEYYTGTYENIWSDWILSNTLRVQLLSDANITGKGFKIDKYEVMYLDNTSKIYPYDIEEGFITGKRLDELLDLLPCKEMYLLFDSCFSGGLITNLNQAGRMTMTSAHYNQYSLEDKKFKSWCVLI